MMGQEEPGNLEKVPVEEDRSLSKWNKKKKRQGKRSQEGIIKSNFLFLKDKRQGHAGKAIPNVVEFVSHSWGGSMTSSGSYKEKAGKKNKNTGYLT